MSAPMGIAELQKRLQRLVGGRGLEVTGKRDEATEDALLLFQRKFGISEDGFKSGNKLSDETLRALREMDQDMEPGWLD